MNHPDLPCVVVFRLDAAAPPFETSEDDYKHQSKKKFYLLRQLQQSNKEVVIANDQQDLLSWHLFGSRNHRMPRNFVAEINQQINNMAMARLEQALAENHRYFRNLPGGKGRRFQQVGRTSAGFKGGVSFAGRASLIRAGTGRRQLKRRLSLRRRRGRSVNPARKDVKLG